jgi:thiol:disulfide interchange protein DsbD
MVIGHSYLNVLKILCLVFLTTTPPGILPAVAIDEYSSLVQSPPSVTLTDAPTKFLPVDQAYQLTPSLSGRSLIIDWSIAPGYYLYKHRFVISPVNRTDPAYYLDLEYQQGKRVYDEYYGKDLEVYYSGTQIRTELTDNSSTSVTSLRILSQACADAGLCYPPRTQYLNVNVAAGTVEVIDTPSTKPKTVSYPMSEDSSTNAYNLSLMLLLALGGGIILNLMPCVFPVLSIKVMATTSAHLGEHNKHLHSIAYAAGIIISFISIAGVMLVLKSAGQAVGWGFQLQSPVFVALLAYLLFIIAQSFSGQLDIGSRWMNVGQRMTTGNSFISSFMTGVLATVVASPCTAPFMGTALGFALTQSAAINVAIFGTLGLGMALPFLVLSWVPGLMEKLPAPGPWMNTFSQLLAFPLYASVIWLLWVLGHQTSVDHAIVVSLGILLLAFAIFLHKHAKNLAGIAIVIGALTVSLSLAINPDSTNKDNLWQPYSSARLAQLQNSGKAVFINLTADWCITCLVNEKVALNSTAFKSALKSHHITYLKGDWTNDNPEITVLLNKYGRSGVPLYLYFDQEGSPAKILPQLLTQKLVLDAFASKGD